MSANLADAFLAGLDGLANRPLPDEVARQAKMSLIDYLACTYLGQSMLGDKAASMLGPVRRDAGSSALIGMGCRASAHAAALVNGVSSHVAELDDGHRFAMMHVGAPVFSALLALSGAAGIDGERFVKGTVMGYEAAIRLAGAIQPGHKLKGFHATGTCGAVGAALGIAYALDYSQAQVNSTLAAAATGASGLLEMMEDGSELKPYNVGQAAASGVSAALAGCAGLTPPADALGGKRGLFGVAAQDVDEAILSEGLDGRYAIETIYRKPYAACRHSHAAIEAAMTAAREGAVAAADIEGVLVETYGLAVGGHDHTDIAGPSSAKMSIPYSVAAALVFGAAGYQQFQSESLDDVLVKELTPKVSVVESAELSALVPAKRAAIVRIRTAGREFAARVDYPKGEPENPIAADELEGKFCSLMSAAGQGEPYARELLECAWQVEDRFPGLLDMLR